MTDAPPPFYTDDGSPNQPLEESAIHPDSSYESPSYTSSSLSLFFRRHLNTLFTTHINKSRTRLKWLIFFFLAAYGLIAGRLIYFGVSSDPNQMLQRAAQEAASTTRPDILDRNGEVLATDIKITSVFAEPRHLIDKDEATDQLTSVLPDVNARELYQRLNSRKGFVWVKRSVSPKEQTDVFRLGLPGVGFLPENKRVYPNGPLSAHILGFTSIDNVGIAGIEKYIDEQRSPKNGDAASQDLRPFILSIDLKATHIVREELMKGIEKFKAKAGAAAIMDVNTGEVIALVSLPDYDPNTPSDAMEPNRINRMSVGVYEMGSTFKALTLAMGLEGRKVTLNTLIDAREDLRYGRFTIHDFHAQHRMLTLPEVFTYSSNIGTARIALMSGVDAHKAFLRKARQLDRLKTELPENAEPILPSRWTDLNTMTIAFGHGLAVAPLQAMMAVAALTNGGYLMTPTFLKRTEEEAKQNATRLVRPEVSEALRYLMRLNAEVGSAKSADIKGYFVGGKTGTADKVINGRYAKDVVFTTFTAIVPSDKPRYLFLTVMDEPQGLPETHGYRTAAYNAGYVTGRLIERVTPLLNLPPRLDLPQLPFPLLAKMGYGFANHSQRPQ